MTDQEQVADVIEAENQALDKFETLWEESKRDSEIYGLKHWTDAERDAIIAQGRIPYKFDKTSHAINTLLGAQRDTRFDIFFYEREEADSLKAEISNALWKYYSDKYDFIHAESDVFLDGVVAKYGVFQCEVDKTKDVGGDLKVSRIAWDNVLWDANFRQYDLTDAYWMSRMKFWHKDELKKRFPDPEKVKMIDLAGLDANQWANVKRLKQNWYDPKKQIVSTREFFERDWIKKYFIWQQGSEMPEPQPFETEEAAKEVIQQRMQIVDMAILSGMMPEEQRPYFEVQEYPISVVTRKEVLLNGVLDEKKIFPLGDFPYTVFFPYFHDGEFWSKMDRLKDPQIFINRMYSQADNWIGSMAKGLLIGDSRIPDAEWKKMTEAFGKTGGAFRTKYSDSIKVVESRGPAPQMFTMIEGVAQLMDEDSGGENALGFRQTASESGRAVLARQAQAGLDNFVVFDNMRRTKQNLGVKIAWYLKNMPTPKKVRILGDKLSIQAMQAGGILTPSQKPNMGYLEVNTTPDNTITDVELDVVVDEAQHSTTKNWATINALTDAMKSGAITEPIPFPVLMELLPGIPTSVKQLWEQYHQQTAEANKPPPMKISAGYKDLPPQAKLELLNEMGLPANIIEIATKEILDHPHLTKPEREASGHGKD